MAGGQEKAKAKGRKIGRNLKKPSKMRYRANGRLDRNKERRILAMMKRFPSYALPPGWKKSLATAGRLVRDR